MVEYDKYYAKNLNMKKTSKREKVKRYLLLSL